jgi:hypothetical protein
LIKAKEQQDTLNELSSVLKEFIKVQSCVKKLQGNIAKIHTQVECRTFNVSSENRPTKSQTYYTPRKNGGTQITMGNQLMSRRELQDNQPRILKNCRRNPGLTYKLKNCTNINNNIMIQFTHEAAEMSRNERINRNGTCGYTSETIESYNNES